MVIYILEKEITILINFDLKKKMKCNILKRNGDTNLFSWLLHAILAIAMLWLLLFKEHYCKPLNFLLFEHLQTFTTTLHCLHRWQFPLERRQIFHFLFSSCGTPSIYFPLLITAWRVWINLPLFIGEPSTISLP